MPKADLALRVARWYASGDMGVSSEALACTLMGWDAPVSVAYGPADLGDFGRCVRLIRAVPEARGMVDVLARTQDEWARVAPHWDAITDAGNAYGAFEVRSTFGVGGPAATLLREALEGPRVEAP